MAQEQSIKKNYIYNTFYQILTLVTPLITTPYLSRVLGADCIGIQSYTASIESYFFLFATLGTATYGQREIARFRDNPKLVSKAFWQIEIITIISTVICLMGWFILALSSREYGSYYLVMTFTVLGAALDITWFYEGYERFDIIVARNTLIKVLGIVIIFIFVRSRDDLLLYIGLSSFLGMLGQLSMWVPLKKFIIKVPLKELEFKESLKQVWIYFVPTIASTVYTMLDKTMLQWITKDKFQNGYYEQANKFINMGNGLICSLNTVMSSRMSYLFERNKKEEIKEKLAMSIDYILLLGILIWFGLTGTAKGLIPWFCGNGYEPVIFLLMIYSPLILIIGISNCLVRQLLIPSGQRARSTKGIILGAVINMVINLVLIPFLAAKGAAIASIVAEVSIVVIFMYMSREYLALKKFAKGLLLRLFSAGIMLVVLLKLGDIWSATLIYTLLEAVIGTGIYFFVLIMLRDRMVFELLGYVVRRIWKK